MAGKSKQGSSNTKPVSLELMSRQDLYFNRELSWIEFNARVLEKSEEDSTPLLERIKFLSIFASNLDEFFMVRVAGMRRMLKEGIQKCESPEQFDLEPTLLRIKTRVQTLIDQMYRNFNESILEQLASHSVSIRKMEDLNSQQIAVLGPYFQSEVFPVLTPLAVDSSHPFPFLTNLGLYLLVNINKDKQDEENGIAFVRIPEVLPRLVPIPSSRKGRFQFEYVLMEDLIQYHLETLFLGCEISSVHSIRVTRDLDYQLLENSISDLLAAIKSATSTTQFQEAVRLEVSRGTPDRLIELLCDRLEIQPQDVYSVPGPLNISGFMRLPSLPLSHLKEEPFNPRLPARMSKQKSVFNLIREQDLFVHHPFDSFYAVTEFLSAAAADDQVLAIKQTLYRCAGDSPIIEALIQASEAGKQVTVVIELKARFDERNNIVWANRLARAGVNVVFGFVGLKTHAKMTLVARKERNGIRRYIHLSTGNYNSQTAKIYTDVGILTCDEDFGSDVSALFNVLTGVNVFVDGVPAAKNLPALKKLAMAPTSLRNKLLFLIDQEIDNESKKSGSGHMVVKTNALIDKEVIDKLYQASQAGVKIELIVRGICCLKPGVKGLSENILVHSIVDRFLEHSRIFYFANQGAREIFVSSADWMPRNFDRRVEVLFPIIDEQIKDRILEEILGTYQRCLKNSYVLDEQGNYLPRWRKGNETPSAQKELIEIAREGGLKSIPYEKAIRQKSISFSKRPVARNAMKKSSKKGVKKSK